MKPVRKTIPIQIVPFVMVERRACCKPAGEISTAPICVMPRFSIRSPTLAQTTIARIMTRVLIRIRNSCPMLRELIVSGSRRLRHGEHRPLDIAALAYPLPTLRAQLQEVHRFMIQPLALVAVPKRFAHDAPDDSGPEVVLIVEAVHARHHFRLR